MLLIRFWLFLCMFDRISWFGDRTSFAP